MDRYPIPANMEGQRSRSPYSRFNTMFNPRLLASDLAMGALPGPTGLVDRMTGNNIRNQMDRFTGATSARNQREYDAYMRQLMSDDPGNERNTLGNRVRSWFNRTFSRDGDQGGGGMAPGGPSFAPYFASENRSFSNPQWGTGGPAPTLGFQQFMGPTMNPAPMYGTGQGMFRAPPAPLYGTGQGMMRAPEQSGGGGSSGGGGGGAQSGGGILSPGGRLLSHGVATRIK